MSCRLIVKCYFYLIPFYNSLYMFYICVIIPKQFVFQVRNPACQPPHQEGSRHCKNKGKSKHAQSIVTKKPMVALHGLSPKCQHIQDPCSRP